MHAAFGGHGVGARVASVGIAQHVISKGQVKPSEFRAAPYEPPSHLGADLKTKWRAARMALGDPVAGTSPALQQAEGLNLDVGVLYKKGEGAKLRGQCCAVSWHVRCSHRWMTVHAEIHQHRSPLVAVVVTPVPFLGIFVAAEFALVPIINKILDRNPQYSITVEVSVH